MNKQAKSGYEIYNKKVELKQKVNLLDALFPALPSKKYPIIYADPPWHYNGKMQFDKSGTMQHNQGWQKDIFISSACFKYPTVKTEILKTLDVTSIASDDSLLFMWTTNPHLQQAIELGKAWGFEYKTVAFVWDKMVHNPGQYTLSYCELCLLFKRGRIPNPRGARNIKQLLSVKRTEHSEKPDAIANNIEKMFPSHNKIELFARSKRNNWDVWGLEDVYNRKNNLITSKEEALNYRQSDLLDFAHF